MVEVREGYLQRGVGQVCVVVHRDTRVVQLGQDFGLFSTICQGTYSSTIIRFGNVAITRGFGVVTLVYGIRVTLDLELGKLQREVRGGLVPDGLMV